MRNACEGFAVAVLCTPLFSAVAAPRYSDWAAPTHLGCAVNSVSNDQGPAISKNGLSLYFGSNRVAPDAQGDFDLYVMQRASVDAAWGPPINLGPGINSAANDNVPSLSRDNHWLFFNSARPGGFGDIDLWVSYRQHVHDDFAWETPVNLGPGINTAGFDAGSSYFENEGGVPQLYFNRAQSQATQATTSDIYMATLRSDGTFGDANPVTVLNSTRSEQRPSVRHDGLEIFFFSNRVGSTPDSAGNPSFDLWTSTRNSVSDDWGTPVRLSDTINTAFGEINPHISPDGLTLFFASGRPGCGGQDLYMTTRSKLKERD